MLTYKNDKSPFILAYLSLHTHTHTHTLLFLFESVGIKSRLQATQVTQHSLGSIGAQKHACERNVILETMKN